MNTHEYVAFLAISHAIVAVWGLHYPLDHYAIALSYLLSYLHLRYPSAFTGWANVVSRLSRRLSHQVMRTAQVNLRLLSTTARSGYRRTSSLLRRRWRGEKTILGGDD